jgi:hypothetical protein
MRKLSILVFMMAGLFLAGCPAKGKLNWTAEEIKRGFSDEECYQFCSDYYKANSKAQATTLKGYNGRDILADYYPENIGDFNCAPHFDDTFYIFGNDLEFVSIKEERNTEVKYKKRKEKVTVYSVEYTYDCLGKFINDKVQYDENPYHNKRIFWLIRLDGKFKIFGDSLVDSFSIRQEDVPILEQSLAKKKNN